MSVDKIYIAMPLQNIDFLNFSASLENVDSAHPAAL